jgi:Arc/MetJ-type ribon-helix-helix transcriptional regulator
MRERVTVRMTDDMIARLDAWIASQSGYVSRQEAVRRCVELALEKPGMLGEGGPQSAARIQVRNSE